MRNISFLFVAFALFIVTACGTSESNKVDEPMVCHNTGAPCLKDHSCCIVKEEAADSTVE